MVKLFSLFGSSFLYILLSSGALAADSTQVNSSDSQDPQEAQVPLDEAPDRPGLIDYVNRYEYGLDLRRSRLIDEDTNMFQVQWNKRYWWGTWLGLGFGGTPDSITSRVDGNKTSVSVIYAGVNLEQTILRYSHWLKAHIGVFLGRGKLFARYEPEDTNLDSVFNDVDITVLEPYFVTTFFNRWGLEFGINVATRGITAKEEKTVNNADYEESDYSALAMGLTIRKGL